MLFISVYAVSVYVSLTPITHINISRDTLMSTVRLIAPLAAAGLSASAYADYVSHTQMLKLSETSGAETVSVFDLLDHLGGIVSPQAHGLRLDALDNFEGTNSPISFTFEDDEGNSTVQFVVTESSDGSRTININGTVTGNSANPGIDHGTFALDVTYIVDASVVGCEDNDQKEQMTFSSPHRLCLCHLQHSVGVALLASICTYRRIKR